MVGGEDETLAKALHNIYFFIYPIGAFLGYVKLGAQIIAIPGT